LTEQTALSEDRMGIGNILEDQAEIDGSTEMSSSHTGSEFRLVTVLLRESLFETYRAH
jgi:hypothetical protein